MNPGSSNLPLAALTWQPAAPAVVLAVAALLLTATLVLSWRSLRGRFGARRAWPIVVVRGAALLLVLTALFDPSYRRVAGGARQRVLVLLDQSGSMRVADRAAGARAARAGQVATRLRDALPSGVEVVTWPFDSAVRRDSAATPAAEDGTDIGGALLAAAEQAGDVAAVVLLTDGGDETPRPARLPQPPLAIVGFGSDPEGWRDVAIAQVTAPAAVERAATFTIEVDLLARGASDAAFGGRLRSMSVTLESRGADATWSAVDSRQANLTQGRARVSFETSCAEAGPQRFRVQVAAVTGELSDLNNRRAVRVDVRREALDVLYFSRRLGADLKMLRQELSADPALTFSALYRVGGERYMVQADEGVDADALVDGLPPEVAQLRAFDCLIVGSFPAHLWTAEEMRVLLSYVEQGGGLIWLGGDESFEGGGYDVSPLRPLIPWRMAGGASTLLRGSYPVSIPPAAVADPAVAGLRELLSGAGPAGAASLSLASVNVPGALAPGAAGLMEADLPQGRVPWIVTQPYGRGRVITVGSNTAWQWGRTTGPSAQLYRRLWRQLVRAAAGQTEGGRVLQVTWDQVEPRPFERTVATVRVTEPAGVSLRATLADGEGTVALPLARGAADDTWRAELMFRHRGDYVFRVVATRGGETLETYEKTLAVSPLAEEGTRLERRDADLAQLAGRAGGFYAGEERAEDALATVANWLRASSRMEHVSVVSHKPWFLAALLALLVAEWALRRRLNLI